MHIPVDQITVPPRFRRDLGDLSTLADSIATLGLLQPIGVTAEYVLVFGERRLRAVQDILKRNTIEARVVNLDSLLDGEYAENEVRKDFTISERTAIAEAIERELAGRVGRPVENTPNIAEFPKGESREIAASRAGFSSRGTYVK